MAAYFGSVFARTLGRISGYRSNESTSLEPNSLDLMVSSFPACDQNFMLKLPLQRYLSTRSTCRLKFTNPNFHSSNRELRVAATKWTSGKTEEALASQSGRSHGTTPFWGGRQDIKGCPQNACNSRESLCGPTHVPDPLSSN